MDTLIKSNPESTWTLEKIKQHINSDFSNVEKAMVRLHANRLAVNENFGFELNGHRRSCFLWIEMFSRYIQGRNEKDETVYKPKSLLDKHAKIFHGQKQMPKGYSVEELAREIALHHADYILYLTMKNLTPQLQISYNYPRFHIGVMKQPVRRDRCWAYAVRKDKDTGESSDNPFISIYKIEVNKFSYERIVNLIPISSVKKMVQELGFEAFNEIYSVYERYEYTTD